MDMNENIFTKQFSRSYPTVYKTKVLVDSAMVSISEISSFTVRLKKVLIHFSMTSREITAMIFHVT